jgi:hypothetical protein
MTIDARSRHLFYKATFDAHHLGGAKGLFEVG